MHFINISSPHPPPPTHTHTYIEGRVAASAQVPHGRVSLPAQVHLEEEGPRVLCHWLRPSAGETAAWCMRLIYTLLVLLHCVCCCLVFVACCSSKCLLQLHCTGLKQSFLYLRSVRSHDQNKRNVCLYCTAPLFYILNFPCPELHNVA